MENSRERCGRHCLPFLLRVQVIASFCLVSCSSFLLRDSLADSSLRIWIVNDPQTPPPTSFAFSSAGSTSERQEIMAATPPLLLKHSHSSHLLSTQLLRILHFPSAQLQSPLNTLCKELANYAKQVSFQVVPSFLASALNPSIHQPHA